MSTRFYEAVDCTKELPENGWHHVLFSDDTWPMTLRHDDYGRSRWFNDHGDRFYPSHWLREVSGEIITSEQKESLTSQNTVFLHLLQDIQKEGSISDSEVLQRWARIIEDNLQTLNIK